MTTTPHVHIAPELLAAVDDWAIEAGLDRETAVAQLLGEALAARTDSPANRFMTATSTTSLDDAWRVLRADAELVASAETDSDDVGAEVVMHQMSETLVVWQHVIGRDAEVLEVTTNRRQAEQAWVDAIRILTTLHWWDGQAPLWSEAEWVAPTGTLSWRTGWIDPAAVHAPAVLVDEANMSSTDRILGVYDELVYEPGGWVSLTRLREHLADIERSILDQALRELFRDGRIRLIAEVNQKTLTDADRAAALHIVGDDKHLYQPAH